MSVLIISYDLVNPGQDHKKLLQLIKSYSGWARLGGSAYLISTNSSPKSVRDHLVTALDRNDKIYIGVATAPAAWYGMPDDVSKWILANQK